MPKIVEANYQEGRALFAGGGSLRAAVERVIADGGTPDIGDDEIMSFVIGFADAFLDKLRGVK